MTDGKDQTGFVLFRYLAVELDPIAQLKLGVAVVIKSKCGRPIFETEVGIEKKRIFENKFAFVAALRNFRRDGEWPAVRDRV